MTRLFDYKSVLVRLHLNTIRLRVQLVWTLTYLDTTLYHQDFSTFSHATFLMDIRFIFNPRSGMYSRHIYTSPNSLVHHYTCSSRQHHLIIYLGRVNGSIMTCINVTLFHLNFSSMIYQPRALNYFPHLQLQGMSIMYHYPPSKNHFYT